MSKQFTLHPDTQARQKMLEGVKSRAVDESAEREQAEATAAEGVAAAKGRKSAEKASSQRD